MLKHLSIALVPVTLALLGCSSEGGSESGIIDPGLGGNDPGATDLVPATDLALGVENPHGYPACGDDPSVQPSPCIDYNGAVRCALDTGYRGDELALCEADPEESMVLHFGPSDYDDPAAVEPFLLEPGGEAEFCMYLRTPNEEKRYVGSYHGRMRPNSHHLIVTMPGEAEPSTVPFDCKPQVLDRWLFGSQDPQIDVQQTGLAEPGDPDYGLALVVPANETLLFDFHNVNTTSEPELREAWASLRYIEDSKVEQTLDMLAFYQLSINVPPYAEVTTQRKTCVAPSDRYVGLITGHAHRWLTRMSVWHDTSEESKLVYETIDWAEPGNALYRSGFENPSLPIDGSAVWGAPSGYLHVRAGESISFECAYRNTEDYTLVFGDTSADEMCNVFGMYFPTDGNTWNCF
jgi:hypothetical protein